METTYDLPNYDPVRRHIRDGDVYVMVSTNILILIASANSDSNSTVSSQSSAIFCFPSSSIIRRHLSGPDCGGYSRIDCSLYSVRDKYNGQ